MKTVNKSEEMDTDKLSLATELIQLCLVPELITDIDTQQIEAAHFKQFKQILDENLHLLFDLIQKYENELFEKTSATQSFRKGLVILLCEQSADNVPFKTDQVMLQQNVVHLSGKWFRQILDDQCVLELVLQHYKTLIKVDVWKKNVGAVFGFHRFCELHYKSTNLMEMSEVFFVLATGTLLLEHYEPTYKQMGIDLFNILMTFSHKQDIKSANIHDAVYATCSANIPKIQDRYIDLKLWKCLYKCVELDDSWKRTSDWHKVDELMTDLLKRIAFEGNLARSSILFCFAAKFGALPLQHCAGEVVHQLNLFFDRIGTKSETYTDWDSHRLKCRNVDSFIVYKWVKKMLLLISNQNMIYGDDYDVLCNLQAIHFTYIIWIFPVTFTLISSPVLDMLTKFVPTLLDCYRRYKTNNRIADEIRHLFTTFVEHFLCADVCPEKNVKIAKRLETLETILSHLAPLSTNHNLINDT